MMAQTNERAFDSYVEEILLAHGGWKSVAVTGKIDVRAVKR